MDFIAARPGRDDRRADARRWSSRRYAWWAPLAARRRLARDALAAARERGLARPQHRRGPRAPSATPTTRIGSRSIRRPRRSSGCSVSRPGPSTASSRAGRRLFELQCEGDATARAACALEPADRRRARTSSCSWSMAPAAVSGRARRSIAWSRSRSAAVTTSDDRVRRAVNWALDGAAAPVGRGAAARGGDGAGRRARVTARPPPAMPAREIRFRDVTFAYPAAAPVLDGFDLDDPGRLVAGHRRTERRRQDDAREAAVPALRPAGGRDRSRRRRPARHSTSTAWRARVAAVFQDFIRFELPLRDNVAPAGAPDEAIRRGARRAPAPRVWPTSTRCSRAATRAAPISRAASGSASRWRARCAPSSSAPASCCSTSRPRSSTCAARPRSSTAFSPPRGRRPRFSSRTASRPSATPIGSACSSTAAWSSSARTTS